MIIMSLRLQDVREAEVPLSLGRRFGPQESLLHWVQLSDWTQTVRHRRGTSHYVNNNGRVEPDPTVSLHQAASGRPFCHFYGKILWSHQVYSAPSCMNETCSTSDPSIWLNLWNLQVLKCPAGRTEGLGWTSYSGNTVHLIFISTTSFLFFRSQSQPCNFISLTTIL